VSPLLYGLEVIFLPEVVKNLFSEKQCCRFCTCIQNQIIHKHLHVDYNPLQGMLVLISSLQLSTSPLQLVQKVEITRGKHGDISMSNCFPGFIVRWILNFVDHPTHENHKNWYTTNKSDFTVLPFASNFCNFTSHWTE
jgi:hypothetical protein